MKKKFMLASLCMTMAVIMLTACGQSEQTQTPEGEEVYAIAANLQEGLESIEVEADVAYSTNINLLTGIADLTDEAVGKRPVAVMVNNIAPAFPQYGIAQADIIFEIVVEGNQTRFMAMYGDYTQVPDICSVRSVRKYFPAISEGFDAVFINWGRHSSVLPYLQSLNLTRYEGLVNRGNLFARDQERLNAGYALEHTGYFKGTELAKVLKKQGKRVEIEDDKKDTAFQFADTVTKPEGDTCTEVKVNFGAALAGFTYNEETNTYLKSHNGEAQMDGRTNTQLEFTNVFVLEADITADANGLHRDVDWSGGNGYYVSNGVVQKIKWSKASEESRLMFYDEDGNELVLNRGKSYIGINYIGQATFK